MRSLTALSFLVSLCPTLTLALKLPFGVHTVDSDTHTHVARQSSGNVSVPIGNTQNSFYYSNITLGGRTISVMLDTGSSDLWVTGSVPGAQDTGKSVTLSYAVGQAAGNINTATLEFDGYTVDNQAFLLVTNTSSFSTNINAEGYNGLIGLGPNSGSAISKAIGSSTGDNMLNRIFQQNSSAQNYISLILDRKNDPGEQVTGQFTISEVIPQFSNITSMPKIPVETVYKLTNQDQHWQILGDKDKNVIGPDGQPIQVDSIVPKAPSGQLVAVFDSGYTLPQVPRAMSDAIYGRVQGAEWSASNEAWLVPCGQLINLTFNFGGQSYPIHPLDVSSSDFDVSFANGSPACLGTFQPITSAFSLIGEYDMILGMAFLRNTYTLISFGNLIQGGQDSSNPYMQLLSLTNTEAAVNDFIQVRLNGQNLINSSQYALLPASQEQHSPESAAEKKQHYEEMILSRWPYIFVGCLIFVILLVGCCVWRCCRRRKAKAAAQQKAAGLLPGGPNSAYAPLQDSQSTASLVMQPMGGSAYDYKSDDTKSAHMGQHP
ncbi:hypothetical protein SERLA73DRAFT_183562 [Serpula lacrymans var. lacrymans S7.3]|uniref:Peptidase A1 domain-containing protein n=2 Tax=Serpula lacrymans var. lacrymans TaxID=341189 RepID=F8Q038_SERL3|nr:uncharacterized protein SERLADRAFT_470802 [Serpula lacrymans var. lacrymans S7.9]EGN98510.1 hypothetical protein SERLA73DRAFT_183562 [Serpula lacrymans var. lacrymans S7.3]EGO24084.1 hypothetical protein SERLADRAFT_470802 [Serpula lacrymans var. lacrymans S7.9]